MAKISIIGAGSISFSMKLIPDFCLTGSLSGSTIMLMDPNEQKLETVYRLARRYAKETGADLRLERTTDRAAALEGADFVINTVTLRGYGPMEEERRIAERHGYYRGIGDRVSDYYGGVGAFHQLNFSLGLGRDVERSCRDAWLLQAANPVFEGTYLLARETRLKVVGFCHGSRGVERLARRLGLELSDCSFEVAGFNHCIWLTKFLYRGENAYPLLDRWISEKADEYFRSEIYLKEPWDTELCPASVEMYKLYGLFPVGDTVRSVSPWWFHTDLQAQQKWFPSGGPDSEYGWNLHLSRLKETSASMVRAAEDPQPITEQFPPVMSPEAIVPFIDAVTNDRKATLVLNVPNKAAISGIPENAVVEVPVTISGSGMEGSTIGRLPSRLMLHVLVLRLFRAERILQAFLEGDRKALLLVLMDDPRTRSFEQASALLDEILSQPWNAEAARHYR